MRKHWRLRLRILWNRVRGIKGEPVWPVFDAPADAKLAIRRILEHVSYRNTPEAASQFYAEVQDIVTRFADPSPEGEEFITREDVDVMAGRFDTTQVFALPTGIDGSGGRADSLGSLMVRNAQDASNLRRLMAVATDEPRAAPAPAPPLRRDIGRRVARRMLGDTLPPKEEN